MPRMFNFLGILVADSIALSLSPSLLLASASEPLLNHSAMSPSSADATVDRIASHAAVSSTGSTQASGGTVIGQLSDPQDLGIDAFVDIQSASIEQDGGLLTFVIETFGNIPTGLALPGDSITYLWLIDADNNAATGQPHGDLGSEFNVRAVISQNYGGGFVDIVGSMPGGGSGSVVIQNNRIQISIGLTQIDSPQQFHWRCSTFQIISNMYVPGNPETTIDVANTLPYTPPASVEVTTPLLMLCPSGPANGMLKVEIYDAAGNLLNNDDYHLIFSSSNDSVATVDASGNVTAHAVPISFSDTPYRSVSADGISATNLAVIRSTSTDLVVVHQTYRGEHVAFCLPDSIEGVDLHQITQDYQVVLGTDLAYRAQQYGVGTTPSRGGTQYLVLDVSNDPNTVPCGFSGNPIRLGWEYGKPIDNSCYINNVPSDRIPQWGVMFHEMGHNFNGSSNSFNQFITTPNSTQNGTCCEALATLCGMWSWKTIMADASGLGEVALDSIDEDYARSESYFRQCLADYQNKGADYSTLDPNVLDGILLEMYDLCGTRIWFDLFSTFLPADEPLPYVIDTEAKQATWFVAAMSASSGVDLRQTFSETYGFPIDNDAWPTILDDVQARISARVSSLSLSLVAGWNMISVPVIPGNNSVSAVFPVVAAIFTWDPVNKTYIVPTTVEPDTGYWVAVTGNTTINVTGAAVPGWTGNITAGWNMIGSVGWATPASIANPNDNPDGRVQPFAYWWDPATKSYIMTTTIEPGKGYWVASVQDCTLTVP